MAQAAELAGKLRERRESAGITQERLASMADVGIATVRKIETGVVTEPGYFTVMALMSALGTSPRRARDVNGFQATVRVGQDK